MAIATLEDLQGSIEVVVFPRTFETTRPRLARRRRSCWSPVASTTRARRSRCWRISSSDWDEAAARGPEAFAREVAAGDRGRGGGGPRRAPVAVGPGAALRAPAPVPAGVAGTSPNAPAMAATMATSPLRPATSTSDPSVASLPPIQPAEPIRTYLDGPSSGDDDAVDLAEEPAVPDEARAAIVAGVTADDPIDAGPDTVLHVRFAGAAAPERLVNAMEAFKALLRDRPGATRVVIHVPAPGGGAALPMELRRGVAYDAELLAEVRRRLGEGLVDLQLAGSLTRLAASATRPPPGISLRRRPCERPAPTRAGRGTGRGRR